jgi:ribosomal protein S18 acetylase RimI-like enzyme
MQLHVKELPIMNNSSIRFRPAAPSDARDLAELINYAGEGLPLYLWERMAEPGETAWDVGHRRALRDSGTFSYRNAIVAERDGDVVASLIGYRLPDEAENIDSDTPAMFVPLLELENLAPSTWYVNVLAVNPQMRGRGIGTELLDIAARRSLETGANGQSIIVSDANQGARRLYERCGYRWKADRPMVKEDWDNPGANWVLLVR